MGRPTRVVAGAVASLAVLSLASCAEDASPPAKSPSPVSAKQRAQHGVLTTKQLPPKWKPAPVRDHIEDPDPPKYCGVTALPKPLGAARVDLYARTPTGPFIVQYTSVAEDEAGAKAVLAKLKKVAATCRSDKNGKARYQVKPVTDITDVGEEAVGFHYRVQTGFTSGVVVFRRGDMVVTVVDLGPPAVPYETVRSVAGTVDDRIV